MPQLTLWICGTSELTSYLPRYHVGWLPNKENYEYAGSSKNKRIPKITEILTSNREIGDKLKVPVPNKKIKDVFVVMLKGKYVK